MDQSCDFQKLKEAHEAFENSRKGMRAGTKTNMTKTSRIGFQMGMSEGHNSVMGIGHKENPPTYSETAQQIKMRKAAEKRARRSGNVDA